MLHRNGRLEQGEFRGGMLEGKSQLTQVLSVEETEKIFAVVMTQREAFITVSAVSQPKTMMGSPGQSGHKLRKTEPFFANVEMY